MAMVIKKKMNVTLKLESVTVKITLKVITVKDVSQIILVIQKMESNVTISVNQEDFSLILMGRESVLFSHTYLLGVELQLENVFGL